MIKFGIDAPKAILNCFIGIVCILVLVICNMIFIRHLSNALYYCAFAALLAALFCCVYPILGIVNGSLFLKFREKNWLFSVTNINESDRVLDVGCGGGLLLIEAAKKIQTGKVYGIDIWPKHDQSGNTLEKTTENARKFSVLSKIKLITGRAEELPFEEEFFNVIVSSWAIHNIPTSEERAQALQEMHRTLKSKGTVTILDISYIDEYQNHFKSLGYRTQKLGPRYTFGTKTYLLSAKKP